MDENNIDIDIHYQIDLSIEIDKREIYDVSYEPEEIDWLVHPMLVVNYNHLDEHHLRLYRHKLEKCDGGVHEQ
jgi:hypothetical protein